MTFQSMLVRTIHNGWNAIKYAALLVISHIKLSALVFNQFDNEKIRYLEKKEAYLLSLQPW